MAFLGLSANEVLIGSLLSALSCQDLANLEMVCASGLHDLQAARHWLVYFRQRLPGVVLQGECCGSLEANDASTKASLSKLAAFAPCEPPVVLDSSEELRKLAVKLDVADQTAREAKRQGYATTGAMMVCLQFIGGSVSTPVSFELSESSSETSQSSQTESQSFFLQLGWTTNNDVVLRVTPKEPLETLETSERSETPLSISISTFGTGPQFVSRDSPVVVGGRWWTTNGLCTAYKGADLVRSLRMGLWCVVCICQRSENAPVPQSLRLTRVLDSLALQLPDDR